MKNLIVRTITGVFFVGFKDPSETQDAVKTRVVVVEDPHGNLYSVLYATDSAVTIISSQYDSNTEPPMVLEPYMYTYEDQIHLRYPKGDR